MNILVYSMFFHTPFISALKETGKNITFFSSERRMDETGVIEIYYEAVYEADISNRLICDIVTRCRYLSGINFYAARLKARKMWAAVESYFETNSIDLILSPAVDNYVTDIWFKVNIFSLFDNLNKFVFSIFVNILSASLLLFLY